MCVAVSISNKIDTWFSATIIAQALCPTNHEHLITEKGRALLTFFDASTLTVLDVQYQYLNDAFFNTYTELFVI